MPANPAPKAPSPLAQIQDLTERVAALERLVATQDKALLSCYAHMLDLDRLVEALARVIPDPSPSARAEAVRFALRARGPAA